MACNGCIYVAQALATGLFLLAAACSTAVQSSGHASSHDAVPRSPSASYIGVWGVHDNVFTHAKRQLDADASITTAYAQIVAAVMVHWEKGCSVCPTDDGRSILQWHQDTDKTLRIWPQWTQSECCVTRANVTAIKMIGAMPDASLKLDDVPEASLEYGQGRYARSSLHVGFKIAATPNGIAAAMDEHTVRCGSIHWEDEPSIRWAREIRSPQEVSQVVVSDAPPFVGVVAGGVLKFFSFEGEPKGEVRNVGRIWLPSVPNELISCDNNVWTKITINDDCVERRRRKLHGSTETVHSIDPTASVVTGYDLFIGAKYYRKLVPRAVMRAYPPMQDPTFMWLRVPEQDAAF